MIHILECHCVQTFGYKIFYIWSEVGMDVSPASNNLRDLYSYGIMVGFFKVSICSYAIWV